MPRSDDEIIAASEACRDHLVAPLARDAASTCPVCRTWTRPEEGWCENCEEHRAALGEICDTMLPVSLYRKPSQLRDWLSFYKPGNDEHHAEYGRLVGAILGRFFIEAGPKLVDRFGTVDALCVVPSTKRPPPHPLEAVLEEWLPVAAPSLQVLLARTEAELGHRHTSAEGFTAEESVVRGLRVLLVDDIYTTGARCQAAAHVLRNAGADVPAVLVLGRRVNPDYDPLATDLWNRATAQPFDFSASMN